VTGLALLSLRAEAAAPTITVSETPRQEMTYGMDFERLWSWSGLNEKKRLAELAVKECQVQYVRIAIPCASEMEEGKFNAGAYGKTLDCMRCLRTANPRIRFFASPQPLFESWTGTGQAPWTCFPLWIHNGDKEFKPEKAADYLVRNIQFLRKQGFDIAWLDTKNEVKHISPKAIAQMVRKIREQLGDETPLIVAPSNQMYKETSAWLEEAIRIGETDFFDIMSSHDGGAGTPKGGTAEDFARTGRKFGKPMWNSEMHAWYGPDDMAAIRFNNVLLMIRAGVSGMNDWLSLGNEKKDFKMFRTMNNKSLEVMRTYYIYKKLVNTSGEGHYLETTIPDGITSTAAFLKDKTLTVWALNATDVPVDTAHVDVSKHMIGSTPVEVTFWGPSNPREGSPLRIAVASRAGFSFPLAPRTLYCFEVTLTGQKFTVNGRRK